MGLGSKQENCIRVFSRANVPFLHNHNEQKIKEELKAEASKEIGLQQ